MKPSLAKILSNANHRDARRQGFSDGGKLCLGLQCEKVKGKLMSRISNGVTTTVRHKLRIKLAEHRQTWRKYKVLTMHGKIISDCGLLMHHVSSNIYIYIYAQLGLNRLLVNFVYLAGLKLYGGTSFRDKCDWQSPEQCKNIDTNNYSRNSMTVGQS